MDTKLIIIFAFIIALVVDVCITFVFKKKKEDDDEYYDDNFYDDEYRDDIDDDNDKSNLSSFLNKLISKKEKEFKDLRLSYEEQREPTPFENDWIDDDLRDIDNLLDLTCEDVIKAAKMAKSEALNADLKEVVENINSTIMKNISSNYKNSIEYKIWDPSHRGLDLMQDIVMPLAKFYEKRGFDIKIDNVNNPKNAYSRQYAMITISWNKDLKSIDV